MTTNELEQIKLDEVIENVRSTQVSTHRNLMRGLTDLGKEIEKVHMVLQMRDELEQEDVEEIKWRIHSILSESTSLATKFGRYQEIKDVLAVLDRFKPEVITLSYGKDKEKYMRRTKKSNPLKRRGK